MMALPARAGETPDKPCPDDTDVAYAVTKDDTLWHITAQSYCLSEWPPLFFGVKTLAEYNKRDIGPDPDLIYAGTVVCLPRELTRGKWRAERCAAGAPSSATAGVCGDGRLQGDEICDGAALRGLSCESLELPKGKLACRSDCRGFDTKGCGAEDAGASRAAVAEAPNPCPAGQTCVSCGVCCPSGQAANGAALKEDKRKIKKPLVVRVAAEIAGGVALPLTSEMRDYIYRLVGVVSAGARVTIGSFALAPRAFFLYGEHGTIFNDTEQAQSVIGGGLLVQAGIPIELGAFQLTPGIQVGWLYTKRTITLNDYPFAGQIETQTGHLPFAGLFLRPAYTFGPKRRISVALDLSADIILTRLGDNAVSTNLNTMLLGGLGYAL